MCSQLNEDEEFDAVTGLPVDATATASYNRLEIWDCVEQGGFVWLFFGDKASPVESRPPIPWVPELDTPGPDPAP